MDSSLLYPSHTEAVTVLRPIFRPNCVRSQYGRSVVVVGRTSRSMVVVAILVAARNLEMFKIPYCNFSVAVQSVSSLSALAQLVLWSQYGRQALAVVALLLYSVCGRSTVAVRSHD